jgi:hypothetical protein
MELILGSGRLYLTDREFFTLVDEFELQWKLVVSRGFPKAQCFYIVLVSPN